MKVTPAMRAVIGPDGVELPPAVFVVVLRCLCAVNVKTPMVRVWIVVWQRVIVLYIWCFSFVCMICLACRGHHQLCLIASI